MTAPLPHYSPGDQPEGAGVTILSIEHSASNINETTYGVEYYCCGRLTILTHKQIKKRSDNAKRKGYIGLPTVCKLCGIERQRESREAHSLKSMRKTDYGVTMPMWPVPQSLK